MPRLFGRDYAASELSRLTGSLAQIAGIRLLERADGKARGLRVAPWASESTRAGAPRSFRV